MTGWPECPRRPIRLRDFRPPKSPASGAVPRLPARAIPRHRMPTFDGYPDPTARRESIVAGNRPTAPEGVVTHLVVPGRSRFSDAIIRRRPKQALNGAPPVEDDQPAARRARGCGLRPVRQLKSWALVRRPPVSSSSCRDRPGRRLTGLVVRDSLALPQDRRRDRGRRAQLFGDVLRLRRYARSSPRTRMTSSLRMATSTPRTACCRWRSAPSRPAGWRAFGKSTLDHDRFIRTMGWRQAAKRTRRHVEDARAPSTPTRWVTPTRRHKHPRWRSCDRRPICHRRVGGYGCSRDRPRLGRCQKFPSWQLGRNFQTEVFRSWPMKRATG